MKHTNITNYIRKNIKEFKAYILERKTERELAKIYNCSPATIIAMKKELKLQTRDLFVDNIFNRKNDITHCKSCGQKSKKNTCSKCVQKRTNIAKKEILVDAAGGKCSKCGYSDCIAALDFHHIDPDTKEINLNTNINLKTKLKEIKKCVLLCCRCHRELHWKESIDFIDKNRYAIDKTKERLFPAY